MSLAAVCLFVRLCQSLYMYTSFVSLYKACICVFCLAWLQ